MVESLRHTPYRNPRVRGLYEMVQGSSSSAGQASLSDTYGIFGPDFRDLVVIFGQAP